MPKSVTRQPRAEAARAGSGGWHHRSRSVRATRRARAARRRSRTAPPREAGRPRAWRIPRRRRRHVLRRSRMPDAAPPPAHVLAGPARVDAALDAGGDHHGVAQLDVLLHQRLGARGHRRPGRHPERRAREAAAEGMAGGRPPGHQGQPRRAGGGEVGMGESEAVDRDVVEGWNVARADHLLSENAAVRGGQGDTRARPPAECACAADRAPPPPSTAWDDARSSRRSKPRHAPGRPAVRRARDNVAWSPGKWHHARRRIGSRIGAHARHSARYPRAQMPVAGAAGAQGDAGRRRRRGAPGARDRSGHRSGLSGVLRGDRARTPEHAEQDGEYTFRIRKDR